jgi:hypothetical protein
VKHREITDLAAAYHAAFIAADTGETDEEIEQAIDTATDLLIELIDRKAITLGEAKAKLGVALASLEIRCHDEPGYELLQSLLTDLCCMAVA